MFNLKMHKQSYSDIMTIDDIKKSISDGEPLYLKFVRENGSYRFSDATSFTAPDHKILSQGRPVESAGYLKIYPNGFIVEGSSQSLKIGPDAKDELILEKLLNLPVKSKW